MSETRKDKDLDETKRIMERLVKTPPDHRTKGETEKRRAEARRPHALKKDGENGRDTE